MLALKGNWLAVTCKGQSHPKNPTQADLVSLQRGIRSKVGSSARPFCLKHHTFDLHVFVRQPYRIVGSSS